MIKIKRGKVCGSNYSFALPDGFNLILDDDYTGVEKLAFVADDGVLHIDIYFYKENNSAKHDIQENLADNNFIKMGNFVSVKRGKGTGIGLCYKDEYDATQHYEERYDIEKPETDVTQLYIDIYLWAFRKKLTQTIYEALKLRPVKAFLKSIKYF